MRDFKRLQPPFFKTLTDFDIIIEIGYAQEQKRAFTPKQLSKIGSVTTVRRRLVKLTEQGVVARTTNVNDHRSDLLTLTASSLCREMSAMLGFWAGCLKISRRSHNKYQMPGIKWGLSLAIDTQENN